MSDVIFKPLSWAPKYKVGTNGDIIGQSGNILKPLSCRYHWKVHIYNGKRHRCFVHRLVAEVHLNNGIKLTRSQEVNHKDKNTANNAVSNLEITTRKFNMFHKNYGYNANQESTAF